LDFDTDINLPIHAYEEEIKQTIRDNKVVIITGSTGCGKVRRKDV
jgi:HrpA-like RNA helicase